MNTEWLEYAVRLTVIWTVLLVFYRLVLCDSRDWRRRRYFLLGTYLTGLLLPLLPALPGTVAAYDLIGWSGRVVVGAEHYSPSASSAATRTGLSWWTVAGWLWLAGAIWQAVRTLIALAQCRQWQRSGEIDTRHPYPIIRHPAVPGPCTALGCIFLPVDLSGSIEAAAILHESVHLRRGHWGERLLLLPAQVLLWFHPLVWWLDAELRAAQEYETDAAVVRRISPAEYGRMLLLQATGGLFSTAVSFFSSPLKKRITMLTTKTPGRIWCHHHSFGLATLLLVLVLSCTDAVTETLPAATLSLHDYTQVDEPPRLLNPAYADALETTEPERLLLDYVYREIRYPVAARQAEVEEIYNVAFLIDATGVLQDLEINRADDKSALSQDRIVVIGYAAPTDAKTKMPAFTGPELATEVDRVMQSLPGWQPARQAGRAVPVRVELSFQFKIER
jgi:hypothetical protein